MLSCTVTCAASSFPKPWLMVVGEVSTRSRAREGGQSSQPNRESRKNQLGLWLTRMVNHYCNHNPWLALTIITIIVTIIVTTIITIIDHYSDHIIAIITIIVTTIFHYNSFDQSLSTIIHVCRHTVNCNKSSQHIREQWQRVMYSHQLRCGLNSPLITLMYSHQPLLVIINHRGSIIHIHHQPHEPSIHHGVFEIYRPPRSPLSLTNALRLDPLYQRPMKKFKWSNRWPPGYMAKTDESCFMAVFSETQLRFRHFWG